MLIQTKTIPCLISLTKEFRLLSSRELVYSLNTLIWAEDQQDESHY